jgi:hypothetical protein
MQGVKIQPPPEGQNSSAVDMVTLIRERLMLMMVDTRLDGVEGWERT